ncbi:MAG: hypothetical protein ACM33T_12190 [Solirubrobacterales bacterium]
MKTLSKTILGLAGLLLLAGCTAAADETAVKATTPAFGPGWRHEQMVQAWQKGEVPQGAMMRAGGRPAFGPGMMRGAGPGAAAIGPDGKIDTSKLPEWCPYRTAPENTK